MINKIIVWNQKELDRCANEGNVAIIYWSGAVLRGNTSAELWGDATAVLKDSSTAVFNDNSRGELWDNSSGLFKDNSTGKIGGNASARFYDDAKNWSFIVDDENWVNDENDV